MVFTTVDQSLLGPYSSSASTFLGMGRNRVINGEMLIDQLNAGGSVTVGSSGESQSVDMFVGRGTSAEGVFTIQRLSATPPTGFLRYARITTTTAAASPAVTSQYVFRHKFEGYMLRDILFGSASAKPLSLQFWVRGSIAGTYGVTFVTSGSRYYVMQYTINNANTWEQKTFTVPGDTVGTWTPSVNNDFNILWDIGCGNNFQGTPNAWGGTEIYRASGNVRLISTLNATLDITGVQLEIGSQCTPFEYRPFANELILCQRYYEKSYDLETVPTAITYNGIFDATAGSASLNRPLWAVKYQRKRVVPTVTPYSPSTGAAGKGQIDASGDFTCSVNTVGQTTVCFFYAGTPSPGNALGHHWVADARL